MHVIYLARCSPIRQFSRSCAGYHAPKSAVCARESSLGVQVFVLIASKHLILDTYGDDPTLLAQTSSTTTTLRLTSLLRLLPTDFASVPAVPHSCPLDSLCLDLSVRSFVHYCSTDSPELYSNVSEQNSFWLQISF
jgi:hypothetical protein